MENILELNLNALVEKTLIQVENGDLNYFEVAKKIGELNDCFDAKKGENIKKIKSIIFNQFTTKYNPVELKENGFEIGSTSSYEYPETPELIEAKEKVKELQEKYKLNAVFLMKYPFEFDIIEDTAYNKLTGEPMYFAVKKSSEFYKLSKKSK